MAFNLRQPEISSGKPKKRSELKAMREALTREQVDLDTPLRLSVAAALAYPDGSMTVSGLRREAIKGRLTIERTAGKDYTTLRAIDEMRKLCRQDANHQGYGSVKPNGTPLAESRIEQSGTSKMAITAKALAAARTILSTHPSP